MGSVSNFSLIPDSILIPHNASHEDLGQEGEMIANDMVKEDEVTPFPHECHQFLTMELLHVFSSNVLVACGVGSGLSVYGGLLAGARVVAICASRAHQKFVEKNVYQWLKDKKVVPGTVLAKPAHLLQYEQKKGKPQPKPAPTPSPRPSDPSPAGPSAAGGSGGTPSPNAACTSAGSTQEGLEKTFWPPSEMLPCRKIWSWAVES